MLHIIFLILSFVYGIYCIGDSISRSMNMLLLKVAIPITCRPNYTGDRSQCPWMDLTFCMCVKPHPDVRILSTGQILTNIWKLTQPPITFPWVTEFSQWNLYIIRRKCCTSAQVLTFIWELNQPVKNPFAWYRHRYWPESRCTFVHCTDVWTGLTP